ncbi:restriction endonuclease subunit S [Paraburkholderia sp. HD33-4]|uniref:restriction endonuclease subunit S n=1 Tax=Paraburkholderia sp. HD33-4 TaxID=2883242 RepID=UPI001F22EC45|nr:restriction endonuclease subunit S [Paraburkholderia sp. HD33-4]
MKFTDGFNLLATAPDGIKRLRELILSLAVQGKLVPQDPSDEPASELLKQIRAEKDRLIAGGKIRKNKEQLGIEESELRHELPRGWQWARLGALGDWGAGATPSRSNSSYYGGTIPWFKSGELIGDYIDQSEETVTELALKECSLRFNNVGDVLIAMYGATIGKTAILNVEGTTNQAVCACTPSSGLERKYLLLVLKALKPLFIGMGAGGAQPNISREKIIGTVIGLPPLAEQSRIVAKVEELMALCDALETRGKLEAEQHACLTATLFDALAASESAHQLQENWARLANSFDLILDRPEAVDTLEQTLLQLAVRGLLVPQDPNDQPASELLKQIRAEKDRLIAEGKIKKDKPLPEIGEDEKPFELPEGWEWARFAGVADIASNLVNPSQYRDFQQVAPDSIEKYSGRMIVRRTVSEAGVTSANHLFTRGQILYSKIRPSLCKAVIVDFDGLCSADMYPINSRIVIEYLHRFILSQVFLDQVWVAENRVKMPKLNQEALNGFLIAVPPLAEQSRIVARVEALRTVCADLRQRLAASQKIQTHLAEALVETAA